MAGSTNYNRPPLQSLIDRAIRDFNAALGTAQASLRYTVENVMARIISGQTHGLYGYLDFISRQAFVGTAETDSLENWGRVWGVTRKAATKAAGTVEFIGADGAVIPAGTQVQRSDGATYVVTEGAEISAGAAELPVVASDYGKRFNAGAAISMSLVSTVAGVFTQCKTGSQGIAGGADIETDDDFRSRIEERIQAPPHGGASQDYRAWALDFPGVTRAWVFPQEMGLGTVTVRFMMDDTYPDGIPLPADEAALKAHIDGPYRRPVTAEVYCVAPIPIPLDITIKDLSPATAEVKAAVEAELADMILRNQEPGKTVAVSKIWEAVSIASGESSHQIVSPGDNFFLGTGEIPVLGEITYSVSS